LQLNLYMTLTLYDFSDDSEDFSKVELQLGMWAGRWDIVASYINFFWIKYAVCIKYMVLLTSFREDETSLVPAVKIPT